MLSAHLLRRIPANVRQAKRTYFTSNPFMKKENVPIFGFVTGVVALSVQLFLLYPWHFTLSNQFDELQEKVFLLEKESVKLTNKLDDVLKLEREVKAKERIILDASERILHSQTTTQEKVDTLIKLTQEKRKRKTE